MCAVIDCINLFFYLHYSRVYSRNKYQRLLIFLKKPFFLPKTMSEDSEIECDWKTIPGCVGTVYDPNPLAKNWILLHGPDIPAIQHLKNKLTVNTKSSKRNITQTEAVVEPERDPPAEISTDVCKQKASDTNKRQRRVLPTVGSGNPQAVINIFAKPVNKIVESNWLYDTLSIEQKEIHDFVILKKKNVFYSGSAGKDSEERFMVD